MKSLTLVFYGTDGDAAKAAANAIRKDGGAAQLRHAYAFDGTDEPDAAAVMLLPCVADFDRDRISAVFGDKVHVVTGSVLPPPPPPPPFDPLAALSAEWRAMDPVELKKIAAAVSGGRTVDDAAQAIAVIEAALAARK